jgi:hypothetical protein
MGGAAGHPHELGDRLLTADSSNRVQATDGSPDAAAEQPAAARRCPGVAPTSVTVPSIGSPRSSLLRIRSASQESSAGPTMRSTLA